MPQISLQQCQDRIAELSHVTDDGASFSPQAKTQARMDILMYEATIEQLYGAQVAVNAEPVSDPYPSREYAPVAATTGLYGQIAVPSPEDDHRFPEVAQDANGRHFAVPRVPAWPVQEQVAIPSGDVRPIDGAIVPVLHDPLRMTGMEFDANRPGWRDKYNPVRNQSPDQSSKPYITPPDARIGICICTHGSVPYVHLSLEALRRHNPNVSVLVHDDSSEDFADLYTLCMQYGAGLFTTASRRVPTVGDTSGFVEALRRGHAHELDIVIKCSRRFIINKPFDDSLRELMHNMRAETATAGCAWFGFGFCSEAVAMAVKPWVESGAMAELEEAVRQNRQMDPLPEAWYHRIARKVHTWNHPDIPGATDTNSPDFDVVRKSEMHYPRADSHAAFVDWPLMGLSRTSRGNGLLWHDSHLPAQYAELAAEYGLGYSEQDYQLIPGE